ncbi:MAG: cytoplasmic protein [Phycisphaera sp.]|nr:cytoplasmic protein [Phycisphaera sp.]
MPSTREQFVSEAIEPDRSAMDTARMATGAPGLPGVFTWRGTRYEVARVISVWKDSSPCRNGSPEVYLRKHWYEVETTDGSVMKLYFERQARSKRQAKRRWWLYTVTPASGE